MKTQDTNTSHVPLLNKLIGMGILDAVALYCFPELREKLQSSLRFLQAEWRQWRVET